MSDVFSSRIKKELDYDFLFKNNSLDERDQGIESDLYSIDIFGNPYMIAMGEKRQHPQDVKDELHYIIVYLIVDEKVICKLGVYEIMEEEDKKVEMNLDVKPYDHRDAPYQEMELLLHQKFYTNPRELDPFIFEPSSLRKTYQKGDRVKFADDQANRIWVVVSQDGDQVNIKTDGFKDTFIPVPSSKLTKTQVDYDNVLNEDLPTESSPNNFFTKTGDDDTKQPQTPPSNIEEGEIEEEKNESPFVLKSFFEEKLQDFIDTKKPSESGKYHRMLQALSQLLKTNQLGNTMSQYKGLNSMLNYPKNMGLFRKTGMDSKNKPLVHVSLKHFEDTGLFEINQSLLIVLEYILNIKMIMVNPEGNKMLSFTLIENLDKEKTQKAIMNNVKMLGSPIYKNYDPNAVLFVIKQPNGLFEASNEPKPFSSLSSDQKAQLKTLYEAQEHEYVLGKTQFKTMKQQIE